LPIKKNEYNTTTTKIHADSADFYNSLHQCFSGLFSLCFPFVPSNQSFHGLNSLSFTFRSVESTVLTQTDCLLSVCC